MLFPSTKAVPVITTDAAGSAATALTTAIVERAGKVAVAPERTSIPFTVYVLKAVLDDLATTTEIVVSAVLPSAAVTLMVTVLVPVRRPVLPLTATEAPASLATASTEMLFTPKTTLTGPDV